MAGNPFRWLAGGEFRKAEEVRTAAGPRPRIQKNVKKKEYTIRAEQLVDQEVVKTPYGETTGNPGDWIVWFGNEAQVMTNEQYLANYEEVR